MDTAYRKGEYQKILDKLNALRSTNSDSVQEENEKLSFFQEEVNKIIETLRNRGDQSNSKIHFLLLILPLNIVLIWHMIVHDTYMSDLSIIALLAVFVGLTHYRMQLVINAAKKTQGLNPNLPKDAKSFVKTKILYLEKAMDIKKMRLLLVSVGYIIFFPILLVKLHCLVFQTIPFDSISTAYLIAYLLGIFLWYFYYNRSFEIYEDIEERIELIQSNL